MIRVLQDWREIGEACKFLGRKGLPRHQSGEKAWDFQLLYGLVEELGREAKIIDLGCSGVDTLRLLHAMGFKHMHGVDLQVGWRDRMRQAVLMRRGGWRRPFRLHQRNLTRTGFAAGTFEVATCISVIEHGVDFEAFLREASRLLRSGGLLFVTADYWEETIDVSDDGGEYGLEWEVLSRADVEKLVLLAQRYGFELCDGDGSIPKGGEKCIVWHGQEFTFVGMAWRKL